MYHSPLSRNYICLQQTLSSFPAALDSIVLVGSNISALDSPQLPSASQQWTSVLQSVDASHQEIPPEIVAAKTVDVRHSQVLTDEASTAAAHNQHSDWASVQGETSRKFSLQIAFHENHNVSPVCLEPGTKKLSVQSREPV